MSRNYCFTVNNPTDEDKALLETVGCKYIIYGLETAPNTGTQHYQGFIQFKEKKSFNVVKNMLPRAHVTACNGSPSQNITYCSKEGNFVERGDKPKQGKRNDIETVKNIIKEGNGMRNITDNVNSYQACKFGELYLKYHEKKRDWMPEVIWIWGPSGCGKSRRAREITVDPYTKNEMSKWWDGYDAHEHVIWDDIRDTVPLIDLLRLLDRYECRIECKGGSRQFLATKIVVTSVQNPAEMWRHENEPIEQLMRRITEVIEMLPEVISQKSEVILDSDPGDDNIASLSDEELQKLIDQLP